MPTAPDNHEAHDYAERIRERLHKGQFSLQKKRKNLSEKPAKRQRDHRYAKFSMSKLKTTDPPILTKK